MSPRAGRLLAILHRGAEAVAAALLAIIFVAFILQIVLRYVFNWPVGWTTELSLTAWLWLVLWGAAFVLRDDEEIRLDLVTERAGPRTRRVIAAIGAVGVIVLFGMSLPAAWDYVRFMKVETSSYLKIRMDIVYSIYLLFAAAVVLRALRQLGRVVRGRPPESGPAQSTASAL